MQCLTKSFCSLRLLRRVVNSPPSSLFLKPPSRAAAAASCSVSMEDDSELVEFLDYMEKLKNYEKSGVPKGAGTDTDDGFDLGRMRRLLHRLGDPHRRFKAVHIAGTKGKGSTAAFLCNMLREEGYLVGCYTSPHLFSIRERVCVGKTGGPVSASTLKSVFNGVKGIINQSIEQESGALSHFEVFTALAFLLFSEEKVDIAVIEAGLGGARDATNVICNSELLASVITSIGKEHLAALGGSLESIAMAKSGIIKQGCPVVIGGPFEPHIDRIIRDKASSLNSPVISACDPGIQKILKGYVMEEDEEPLQICDIFIRVQDLQLHMDLPNVKLHMLGINQLQNAVTAACTALCLQKQGWKISEKSICKGLEQTRLLGRSQFLTQKEVRGIGLSRTKILIDGAHTEASAKGLAEVVRMTHSGVLAFVVAMANDKDHVGFARQLLLGPKPELVLLTEASIAGGKSRITSASSLKDAWMRAASDSQIEFFDGGMIDSEKTSNSCDISSPASLNDRPVLLASSQMESVIDLIKIADQLLKSRVPDQPRLIVVTGSLHVVSSVLASLQL